jgi:hypothetical protein
MDAESSAVTLEAPHSPNLVARVNYEDDGLDILIVVFPQVAIPTLAGHVENGERDVVLRELFHRKADRRH